MDVRRRRSMSAQLVAALAELERALGEFTRVYEAWLRDGGADGELREVLAKAEAQLDAAREALERVQDSLRA